ncbi:hypothetical protein ABGN05_22655 [Aquibium sp. LZ166]|uniref:Sulfotransferase family protein n=1 Tax=Aquibium pacificus TaxID=3153579 RepID=A0ABV3SNV0_9HYPH
MTIYLHAGTHKTGSKSFQAMIADNTEALRLLDYDVFEGSHRNPRNHTELHLASLRLDRDSFAKHNWPDLQLGAEYERNVSVKVQSFLSRSNTNHQIFTNEDLSYLRHEDEFLRLRHLFGQAGQDFVVVLVFRKPADFLRSYRVQLLKKPGRVPSDDPTSALYVEEDSWLLDFNALVRGFRDHFHATVRIVDYDGATAAEGSVLPALLRAMDINPDALDSAKYRLNVSPKTIPG